MSLLYILLGFLVLSTQGSDVGFDEESEHGHGHGARWLGFRLGLGPLEEEGEEVPQAKKDQQGLTSDLPSTTA
ncbi:hypothetical protein ANCCAN_02548 [Ancylostoma caninum]|uniref:Uncharacterized protein n=1 Tax=Ancylostoma caninum TaxID=29170 RepID=A0A368H7Y4_ANCCA|nr:hypothetical protein ANCCAN_02548 [Ancylostoma caninum]